MEYVAFDTNVEAKGAAIMSVVAGLDDEIIPILQKHNLYPLDEDAWYRQQDWLNAFKDLNQGDMLTEVAIGMRIPDTATWPPDVKDVHSALASIDVAYQMNHRGGEIGSYAYTQTGENTGTMVCENPYPSDFDYGIIYRTVQKFRSAESTSMRVARDDEKPNRKTGANACTYHIEW